MEGENRMKSLMKKDSSLRRKTAGLSLLELLVTILIIGILIGVVAAVSSKFIKRAEKVKCISHMRTLHTAFLAYMQDKGHWPQMPKDQEWTESGFFKFWIISLEPYGVAQDTWLCPSDKLFMGYKKMEKKRKTEYFGSYAPTPFDDAPGTPLRWNQPWLMERGNLHGNGAHILMPDGSVQESTQAFFGR